MRKKFGALLFMMAVLLLSSGCDSETGNEVRGGMDIIPVEDDSTKTSNTEGQLPPQIFSAQNILSVRLVYTDPRKTGTRWYKVRLDNPRNGWYDYIEITQEGNLLDYELPRTFDDYNFGITNFNKQNTDSNYDPEDTSGIYNLTITSSTGFEKTVRLEWIKRLWAGTDGMLVYQLP